MSAAAAATATAAAPEAPKKKSKKLLFIVLGVVVLALIGAAAALFVLKKNTGDDEYEDGEEPVAQHGSAPKTPPVFLSLENLVINLADPGGNRFIQLGLTLQLQDTATETAVKAYLPSIRSNVLVLISQRTAEEMLLVKGKEKLASDIIATISREMGYEMPPTAEGEGAAKKKKAKAAPNPVQAVLFSSFIVQ
jgi:flagellar FliL protein